ncbi:MAG TPA: ADOP family duplicated permease [Vicinamibacterales bacterium]|jgi:predicted permease
MPSVVSDLRYAVRSLRKSRGFTSIAIASLALGIGANAALFSLVDALLLRSLPVREPDRLVSVARVDPATGKAIPLDRETLDAMRAIPDDAVFEGVAAYTAVRDPMIAVDGRAESSRQVLFATRNLLVVLGTGAALGRIDNDAPAAVISDRFWKDRFQQSPDVSSRTIVVNDREYPIVGVTPAAFLGVSLDAAVDVWLLTPDPPFAAVSAIARMRPGVTAEQARAAADARFRQADRDRGAIDRESEPPRTEVAFAGRGFSHLRDQYAGPLRALMMLVVLVLLITCTNIGNLLVVRNSARVRELAVRAALGARRSRLIAQLLAESVVLAAIGGIAAWFVAGWGVSLLLSTLPLAEVPQQLQFKTDGRMLAFMIATTMASTMTFALAPAWRATRLDLGGSLKSSSSSRAAFGSRRLGWWLVAGQTALSVVLLAGAGLFFQTVRNIARLDLGFEARNLVQIEMARDSPSLAGGDARNRRFSAEGVRRIYGLLSERVAAVPGVESVTAAFNPVLASYYIGMPQPEGPAGHMVGPQYFDVLRIPVVRGRTLTAGDIARSVPAAVVNESYEREILAGEDAIGKRIAIGSSTLEIVGVVRDAKLDNVRWERVPRTFRHGLRESRPMQALIVRTRIDPRAVVQPLQQAVADVVPGVLLSVHPIQDVIDRSIARERMVAATSGFFGILGVVLAGIGLFGVASYAVAQRTSEIGVRLALGASRWDVIRESLRSTAQVFGLGLAAGTIAAAIAARVAASAIAGLLFGLSATDWTNIAAVVVIMIAVAAAACLVPAVRATRIDPLQSIRTE